MTTTARAPGVRAAVEALLNPRNVAFLGASRDPAAPSNMFIAQLTAPGSGFRGRIFPINPNAEAIGGHRAYPSVGAVPEPVDVAVLMQTWERAVEALKECAAAGVKAVFMLSAVPQDPGHFNDAIREAIAGTPMHVLGPNCLGTYNLLENICLTAGFPPPRGGHRPGTGVAAIGHSGGSLLGVASHAVEMGVPFSYFVSCGNEADLKFDDFVDWFLDQPDVKVIVCYLEEIRRPRRLLALADRARELGKAIVAIKVGHSPAGAAVALSHTYSVTGPFDLQIAHLRRHGIVWADSMSQAAALIAALRAEPLPPAPGVGILTTTGGVSATLAEVMHRAGVPLPQPEPALKRVYELLAPSNMQDPAVHNPVDLGAPGVHSEEVWQAAAAALLDQPEIGTLLAVTTANTWRERIAAARVAAAERGKALAVYLYMSGTASFGKGGGLPIGNFDDLAADGVPVFTSEVECADALRVLIDRARFLGEPAPPSPGEGELSRPDALLPVPEAEVQAWLAAHGIPAAPSSAALADWNVGIRNDFGFGPVVSVSSAGVLGDAAAEAALIPAPATAAEAERSIAGLRAAAALERHGRLAPATRAGLATLSAGLSRLAWEHRDDLAELELDLAVDAGGNWMVTGVPRAVARSGALH
jgi:acyl-CoA synthetase (NDP forming)